MTDLDQSRTQQATVRIRELNDQLRISHTGGTLVTTPGVLALGIYLNQAILIAIAAYDDFDEDSDPFGEHDFGLVEVAGQEVLFKIDLYERQLVKSASIGKPFLTSSPHRARRRSRIIRSWPCASAHRLVSGEGASTLVPQSVFTMVENPKAQVANQTTTRLRTAINLPGRQPPRRSRGKLVDLLSDLECGSFRNHAVFDKAPKGYRKLSSQRDNADLAPPHAFVSEALVPPQRQPAVGLVSEPEPSQLDQCLPSELGARFTDASIPICISALVRTRRKPHERRNMPPCFERAVIDPSDEHSSRRFSHAPQHLQPPDLFCMGKASAVVSKRFLSVSDNLVDLLRDKIVAPQHTFNVASEKRSQPTPVTGDHHIEAFPQPFADALAGEPNPVQRQKPFNAPDYAD